jgi:arginyl-tRNA synthetase
MADQKEICRAIVTAALNQFKEDKALPGDSVAESLVHMENPPRPEMGDIDAPMFPFAKTFRMAPPAIAAGVADVINAAAAAGKQLGGYEVQQVGSFAAVGPYVNVKLNKADASAGILRTIVEQGEGYGSFDEAGNRPLAGRRVMVEYSSPNTNKPLHLGHMRNDALGESVSRILKKAGAEVFRVNIINNRGVHICKSMLAYKLFHEAKGETPESLHMKGDHFVGQCYVEFDKYAKEHPEAAQQAEDMLVQWEQSKPGDELYTLWEKMNSWAISGVKETYERTGVGFEKLYFESETYLKGKEEILKGLEKGLFFKAPDGSVRVDVTEAVGKGKDGEDHEKVLLRKDGTSVYITQDIGTAIFRHGDWAFNQLVYVVASEQIFHFKVLFYILRKLGFEWAEKLHHLSYGLVNLPSGRMKSREGTVVDADDLFDEMSRLAREACRERGGEALSEEELRRRGEEIGLGALKFMLLKFNPKTTMMFDPQASLKFEGDTGPYVQYVCARINSIARKAEERGIGGGSVNWDLADSEEERALAVTAARYPETLKAAAEKMDCSAVVNYLLDLAKAFNRFYREKQVLNAEDPATVSTRLALCFAVRDILTDGLKTLTIGVPEAM